MKRRTKKRLISALSMALVISLNMGPVASIAEILSGSDIFGRLSNLSTNLIYLSQNGWTFDTYADDTTTDSTTGFSCKAEDAIATLMGKGTNGKIGMKDLEEAIKTISGNVDDVEAKLTTINQSIGNVETKLGTSGELYKKLDSVYTNTSTLIDLQKSTNTYLSQILSEIKSDKHAYRVAHVYSLNNAWEDALWRPHSEECPYIEDITTVQGKYANVYMGYWDASVTDIKYTTATKINELGQTVLDPDLLRAYEVLGYDIIRLAEGAVMGSFAVVSVDGELLTYAQFLNDYEFVETPKGDGTSDFKYYKKADPVTGVLQEPPSLKVPLAMYHKDIGTDKISWLDAVTVLYKALGQEEIQYTTFAVEDASITPETSPTSQGLSGITTFSGFNHFVFQTRSNVIKEVDTETPGDYTIDYTYWKRAKSDGFVTPSTKMTDNITFEDFCILAEDMMTAFGEPTISKDELKALLQVYGSDFPIQLGTEVADAWAYLMVRGILIDPTINCTDTITRSELLKMAAAIKDKSFRTDFKNIQITLDLADVMQEDGYYPVKDFEFTQNKMNVSTVYDYSKMSNYTYLIPIDPKVPIDLVGNPKVYKSLELNNSNLVSGVKDKVKRVTIEGKDYLCVSVPKTYLGNICIGAKVTKVPTDLDTVSKGKLVWYVIPSTCLGGGIYAEYKSVGDDNGNITTTIGYSNWHEFDYRSADESLISYADWMRSGENAKPEPEEVAYGLTGIDRLLAYVDLLTSPIVIHAADNTQYTEAKLIKFTYDTKDYNISFEGSNSEKLDKNIWSSGVPAYDESIGFTNRSHITGDYASSSARIIEYYQIPEGTQIPDIASTLIFAKTPQMRMLHRAATLSDFDLIGKTKDIKATINAMLACETVAGYDWESEDRTIRIGIDETKDTYGKVWVQDNIATGEVEKLLWIRKNSLPYLFLTASMDPQYMAIARNSLINEDGILKLNGYKFKYKSKFTDIGSDGGNLTVNQILSDNIDNLYSDEDNNMLNKWIQTYGTESVTYGVTSYLDGNGKKCYTEYTPNTYWISTKHPKGILSDLGTLHSGGSKDSSYTGSGTYNLSSNVASSAIMNRDQQVLISWADLVKCKFIENNDGDTLPKLHDDGTYRFMTDNGQVIVNDLNKTIQIGSVLYDLQYTSGKSPTLVYYDDEQDMLYFDYRCVLGVVSEKFQRTGTTTSFLDNCIGAGKYAVYDLGDGNVKSDTYVSLDVLARNLSSTTSYKSRVANKIVGFDNKKTALGNEYGKGLINNGRRMINASFTPTANWITCIDDDGVKKTGACYVYYPAVAFTYGYIDTNDKDIKQPDLSNTVGRWKDVVSVVNEANAIKPKDNGLSLKEALESTYGVSVELLDPANKEHQPLIMTYYAVAKLYEKTGSYYFTDSWYVREFDITGNAWFQANTNNNMTNATDTDGNDIGIMYWVDSVGYVYNLPDMSQFTWKKYFEGDYMLPLVSDATNSSVQTREVLNLNLDFYGQANTKKSADSRIIPYGGYLTNDGFCYVQCGDSGITDLASPMDGLDKDSLLGQASTSDTGSLDFPIRTDSDATPVKFGNLKTIPAAFTPAPSGIYVFFAKNTYETWTVAKLSNFIVDANRVYYGSSQLSLQPRSIDSPETTFKFAGADRWNAMNIANDICMFRVHIVDNVSTLIIQPTNIRQASASGVNSVEIEDMTTNPLEDWLKKIGTQDLLKSIDEGASFIIVFTFKVIPIIGIILMMTLVGIAFLADSKLFQMLADKFIDPVKILTFGRSDIHHWHWQKVLFPCTLMFVAFALFLNGNLIMLVQSLAKWYGVVSEWVQQVL